MTDHHTNQWLHYYQETSAVGGGSPSPTAGLEDRTTMMTGFATNNASTLENSSITSTTSTNMMSPGGGGNSSTSPTVLKPIRRRSRASKRTPVTLLNASATNFRALVQQFTGCPQPTGATAAQFGRQKGQAVNLSFERNDNRHSTENSTSSRYGYYDQSQLVNQSILPQQTTQGTFSLDMENVSLQNEFIRENGTSSNGGYFY